MGSGGREEEEDEVAVVDTGRLGIGVGRERGRAIFRLSCERCGMAPFFEDLECVEGMMTD